MLLWSGQSVSTVGSRVSSIAFPLLALDVTHSAAQAGLVVALLDLPYVVFGLLAGALADRWNRKRMMLTCDALRALNMFVIPLGLWAGRLSVVEIGLVAALEGTLYTFYDASQTASLPKVVDPDLLPAAMARSHAIVGTAGLLGPPLGGILYQAGRALPFLVDGVSYAASVGTLLFVRTEFQEVRAAASRRIHLEILQGLTWIRKERLIRFTGLIAANNGMVYTALTLIMIVVARQQHASASTIGIMFAIASIGGTAGSFVTAWIARNFSFSQILIGYCWIAVLLWPLYLLISAPLLFGVMTGVLWMISGPFHLVQGSYRRSILPDELQGRVNSVFELAELGADAVGVGLCGVLLQTVGVRAALLILLGWLALQALVVTLNRNVRRAPALPGRQTA